MRALSVTRDLLKKKIVKSLGKRRGRFIIYIYTYIYLIYFIVSLFQAEVFLLKPVDKRPQSVRRRGNAVSPVRAVQVNNIYLSHIFAFV